jgi:hypothetical protein
MHQPRSPIVRSQSLSDALSLSGLVSKVSGDEDTTLSVPLGNVARPDLESDFEMFQPPSSLVSALSPRCKISLKGSHSASFDSSSHRSPSPKFRRQRANTFSIDEQPTPIDRPRKQPNPQPSAHGPHPHSAVAGMKYLFLVLKSVVQARQHDRLSSINQNAISFAFSNKDPCVRILTKISHLRSDDGLRRTTPISMSIYGGVDHFLLYLLMDQALSLKRLTFVPLLLLPVLFLPVLGSIFGAWNLLISYLAMIPSSSFRKHM